MERFTSIAFRNFKAFPHFSIALAPFNVLVGPNNAGKSTVITAFRILAEGLRKARTRNAELLHGPSGQQFGYRVSLSDLPVAAENIFSDYHDEEPASIRFRISNDNHLTLYFTERDSCILFPESEGKPVRTTANFRREFDCDVAFVPILGPVEHNERLFQKEAARLALITHRASRNFRNIWHHYPARFDEFRQLVQSTWPGMDIEPPRLDHSSDHIRLHMFCMEDRIPRELYWAGFGFQVWCQMLTFILEGKQASLLAIDEPDIYLHSDLQRQLLSILKEAGPDILIATHSTELVSGADLNDIVVVTRRARSARRLKDPSQLQAVFHVLGSNLNPTLTQLAKTRRALFVEGKDFQIISWFAERLGRKNVANRTKFAVIPAEGFNPQKVSAISAGIEATIGAPVAKAAIFDRDYRCPNEIDSIAQALGSVCRPSHIHGRKELENYLFVASVLTRAIQARLEERRRRTGSSKALEHDVTAILSALTDSMQRDTLSQHLAHYLRYEKQRRSGVDEATITGEALDAFWSTWADLDGRLMLVAGKELFAKLNQFLMEHYDISLSPGAVVRLFRREEVPTEMAELVGRLDEFGEAPVPAR